MMNWFAKIRWKISTRLASNTAIISTIALAVIAYLIVQRLDHVVQHQKKAIEQLTSDRLFQRLDLQAKLIANELNHLKENTQEVGLRLSSITALRNAIETAEFLRMNSLLKGLVGSTEFDSIIMLDRQSRIFSTHDSRLVKEKARSALVSMSMIARSRGLLDGSSPSMPASYSAFAVGHETYLRAIGIEVSSDQLMVVSMFPLFDEQGEAIATFMGHRLVTSAHPSLVQFEDAGVLGMRILTGEQTILTTGLSELGHQVPHKIHTEKLQATPDGNQRIRCRPFHTGWRLCVHISETHYQNSINQLVKYVKDQNYALVWWLIGVALIIVFLAVISTWLVSLKILEPLNRITKVVHDVAKGNWLARVPGLQRTDEVGEIARAVLVLQQSMKDRERLQSDVDNINEASSRKIQLERELENTQLALRRRLFNLSDLAERLEKNNKKLTDSATDAVGEVDESRLVANRASKAGVKQNNDGKLNGEIGANDVVESIDRLGETLNALYTRTNGVSDDVSRVLHEVQSIDRIVKDLHVTVQNGSLRQRASMAGNPVQKMIELKG